MELGFFTRGLLIGFSIAAPVGPIGVLCVRRTLAQGRKAGLICGLGAATADAAYGCIAAFGLTSISGFLVNQQSVLRLVGGLFLVYLGLTTFMAKPAGDVQETRGADLAGSFLATLGLTLTNPMTILSFAAIFAGLGLGNGTGGPLTAAWMVIGVFVGSALWWLLLSSGVGLFRSRFNTRAMEWINRFSGATIAAFGIAALTSITS